MTNVLTPSSLFILGGRSLIAPYLLERLAQAGHAATVTSREELTLPHGFESLHLDLEEPRHWQAPEGATIVSLLPIWALAAHLALFDKAKAIIAISSTSRFGKATSDDPKELNTVRLLTEGEEALESWAKSKGIAFTILRPTLIYDGENDVNITRIMRTISRFGTFPIAAPGKGLRQPIHADDVAGAIMGALDNPRAANRAFNIAGGEILTYRQMVERVALSVMPAKAGIPFSFLPCPLLLPLWLLKTAFRLASVTGLLREKHFGFAVFQRMNEDLVFDVKEGLEVLSYAPRLFLKE